MKIRATVMLLLVVLSFVSVPGCSSNSESPVIASHTTTTGTGYLKKTDTLWILNLEGDYADMGRQYGALLRNEINDTFKQMDAALGYEKKKDEVRLIASTMDPREMQFLTGMAIESGLYDPNAQDDLGKIAKNEFINAALFFMYAPGGCSAFAATGSATEFNTTVAGRNFDNPRGTDDRFVNLMKGKAILVIYNPRGQSHGSGGTHADNSIAVMSYIGWFHGLTVLTSKGLYLEYNNGTNSIPMIPADLPGLLSKLRDGLHQNLYAAFDTDTLEEVTAALSVPASIGTLTQVADKKTILHFERAPYQNSENQYVRKFPAGTARGRYSFNNPDNASIITNHFVSNDWTNQQNLEISFDKDSASRSVARLINLQALAVAPQPRISAEIMKTIMTTPLRSSGLGGPFISWDLNNQDVTHFTTVTDVAAGIMHIYPYIDGGSGRWTVVDLKREFR